MESGHKASLVETSRRCARLPSSCKLPVPSKAVYRVLNYNRPEMADKDKRMPVGLYGSAPD